MGQSKTELCPIKFAHIYVVFIGIWDKRDKIFY